MSSLKQRLPFGLGMAAAVIAAAIWAPIEGILVVFLCFALPALWESFHLFDKAGLPSFKWFGFFAGTGILLLSFFSYHSLVQNLIDHHLWAVLGVVVVAVFTAQLFKEKESNCYPRITGTLLAILYVPLLFSFLGLMLHGFHGDDGRWLAFYMILIVKISDTGAYFTGTAIGKNKLIPRISPGKTWEGCIGGLVAAVVASVAFYFFGEGKLGIVSFSLIDAIVLPLILGVTGIIGDLIESNFKRSAGVKDSGKMLLGIGGMLDAMDSLLLASPVLYLYSVFMLNL